MIRPFSGQAEGICQGAGGLGAVGRSSQQICWLREGGGGSSPHPGGFHFRHRANPQVQSC